MLRSDNLVNHRAEAAAASSSDRRQKSLIKYEQAVHQQAGSSQARSALS